MTNARDQIIQGALRCFAAKGYSASTIAEIEEAAGLSRGAGGTYAHFKTKRAILEAVIDAAVDQDDDVLAPQPDSLEGAARDGLAKLDEHRELMRLLFHDLDQFPELMERVVLRLLDGPYRLVAERTAAIAPNADAEAIATLLVGALVNFKLVETLVGPRPDTVDDDRIVHAWAHLYGLVIKGNQP